MTEEKKPHKFITENTKPIQIMGCKQVSSEARAASESKDAYMSLELGPSSIIWSDSAFKRHRKGLSFVMTRLLEKRLQRRQRKEVMLGDLVYSPEQIAKCNNCHVGQPGGHNPSPQEWKASRDRPHLSRHPGPGWRGEGSSFIFQEHQSQIIDPKILMKNSHTYIDFC